MMGWGHHMSAGGWIFSIGAMLIVLGLVVAAIGWLIAARGGRAGSTATASSSARETLDRRLASGELRVEQYEQLRAALSDGRAATPDPRPPHPAGTPV
jgi:putative membrane protein